MLFLKASEDSPLMKLRSGRVNAHPSAGELEEAAVSVHREGGCPPAAGASASCSRKRALLKARCRARLGYVNVRSWRGKRYFRKDGTFDASRFDTCVELAKRRMAELIAQHSGQTLEQIQEDSERDRWFTAEAAKDYGLCDAVILRRGEIL